MADPRGRITNSKEQEKFDYHGAAATNGFLGGLTTKKTKMWSIFHIVRGHKEPPRIYIFLSAYDRQVESLYIYSCMPMTPKLRICK